MCSSRIAYRAIHAHVAHLHLVRDAAEGDDGPVLKFKRRDDAQLLHRPRQVADDEAASGRAKAFAFRQGANIAQAFGHDAQAWTKYQCQSLSVGIYPTSLMRSNSNFRSSFGLSFIASRIVAIVFVVSSTRFDIFTSKLNRFFTFAT